MMKKSTMITEISLEDFLKLNLIGYEHRRHFYKEDGTEIKHKDAGELVEDSQGNPHWVAFEGIYSRVTWDKVNLNDVVRENVEWSEREGFTNRCICLAIHTEPEQDEINDLMREYNYVKFFRSRGQKDNEAIQKYTYEEAYNKLLFDYSYLDKWLTREGHQTFLIRCDVPHLYSEKRKFCTHDDYFDVPKNQTKVIYLIRY